ncbi:MAG: hypothetical protein KDD83_26585, partial [Caldilineaceae bacterium]|nr:hypothetical protein [Caldilineaceae bacterium]
HVAHNSGNNEWYTPAEYIEAARVVMGGITLDPASSELANTKVRADYIYTADDDGLSEPWFGKVWLNPPYAAGLVDKFTSKLADEYVSGEVEEAIVLVNNATETGWFASLVSVASAVCFPSQRVRFWSPSGEPGAPLQGQAVVYIGRNAGKFVDCFSELGWCAWVA